MNRPGLRILLPLILCLACNLGTGATELPLTHSPSPTVASATDTPAPSPTATSASAGPGQPIDLLIVTPADFAAAFGDLIGWKEKTGLRTGLLTLEDADRMCPGRDAPERIKQCLSLYQQKSGIRFAMLVGDGDTFPVRFTMADIVGETIGNTAFYPTDLYYADLYKADGRFDDWDANGNGYFGEIGGEIRSGPLNIDQVDLNPDIAVGRVPVSSFEEASIYAEKVIRYEAGAAGAEWARRVLAIATGGYMPDDCRRQEDVLAMFPAPWQAVRLFEEGNACGPTPALTADAVIAELNRGVGLVTFVGHGNLDIWADAITVKDFLRVENRDRLPIIFSGGCGTATFTAGPPGGPYTDIHGVHHAGGSAGEVFADAPPPPAPIQTLDNVDGIMEYSLVQLPTGEVAYVGAITGSQFPALFDINAYFFAAIAQGEATPGEAWNAAIRQYYRVHTYAATYDHADWYVLAEFHQPWKFMLFGDPSLRIGGVAAP